MVSGKLVITDHQPRFKFEEKSPSAEPKNTEKTGGEAI